MPLTYLGMYIHTGVEVSLHCCLCTFGQQEMSPNHKINSELGMDNREGIGCKYLGRFNTIKNILFYKLFVYLIFKQIK